MLKSLHKQWRDVTKVKPGNRFHNRYERRKNRRCSAFVKPFYLMLGATVFIAGLVLMPAPGPGLLLVFLGAGMLAEESLLAARVLDRAELKLRAMLASATRMWKRASSLLKAVIAAFVTSLAALAGWVAYGILFG
jgi:uncharacterized protein (TIGR02611 family)